MCNLCNDDFFIGYNQSTKLLAGGMMVKQNYIRFIIIQIIKVIDHQGGNEV